MAEPSKDRKPRVTGARKLDSLQQHLASLLTAWDTSTNPVLLSAAWQLRQAMATADRAAYREQSDWEQRQYEARLSRG